MNARVLFLIAAVMLAPWRRAFAEGTANPPVLYLWPSAMVMDRDEGGISVYLTFQADSWPVGEGLPTTASADYSVTLGGGPPITGTMDFPSSLPQYMVTLSLNYSQLAPPSGPIMGISVEVSNPVNLRVLGTYFAHLPNFPLRKYTIMGSPEAEGNAGTTVLPFTLEIDKPVSEAITFAWRRIGGTATEGVDFAAITSTGTIAAGATSTTLNVIVNGDTTYEPHETVILDITGVNATLLAGTNTPGAILNDDPEEGPAPLPAVVTESSGTDTVKAWFSVDLPFARTAPVTCRVSTRNGTAISGSDYRAIPPVDITFAAGETHKWVAVTVTATAALEGTEQFFLDVEDLASQKVKSAACSIERFAVTRLVRMPNGAFELTFPTGLGQRYFVEKASAPDGEWTFASSLLEGTGAPRVQTLPAAAGAGFFRVRNFTPSAPGTAAVES